jgi:hypothetical protein
MPYLPKPLISGDQAFFAPAISAVWQTDRSVHHEFQDLEQLFCGLDIPLIAGVVEGDQDFVGQAALRIALLPNAIGPIVAHCIFIIRSTPNTRRTRAAKITSVWCALILPVGEDHSRHVDNLNRTERLRQPPLFDGMLRS